MEMDCESHMDASEKPASPKHETVLLMMKIGILDPNATDQAVSNHKTFINITSMHANLIKFKNETGISQSVNQSIASLQSMLLFSITNVSLNV